MQGAIAETYNLLNRFYQISTTQLAKSLNSETLCSRLCKYPVSQQLPLPLMGAVVGETKLCQ